MTGMLRVPRSRGALSGLLLILLGAWGALIPFIGPYFHYAYTPDQAWVYNTGRLWLEVLPGAGAFLGGLIVLSAGTRPAALFGSWLAAMSGAWFVVGQALSTLWTPGGTGGQPVGSTHTQAFEQIGFYTGLGAVIIFFAALALGRFTVIGAREVARATERAAAAEQAAADERAAQTETAHTEPTQTEPVRSTAPDSYALPPRDTGRSGPTPDDTTAVHDTAVHDTPAAEQDEPRESRHAMPWSRSNG